MIVSTIFRGVEIKYSTITMAANAAVSLPVVKVIDGKVETVNEVQKLAGHLKNVKAWITKYVTI